MKEYTFVINNFTKPYILYKAGMRIATFSSKDNKDGKKSGWVLSGYDI